jgi:hypothetical protein
LPNRGGDDLCCLGQSIRAKRIRVVDEKHTPLGRTQCLRVRRVGLK